MFDEQDVFLARVFGSVVASVKSPGLEGQKLLLIRKLTPSGEPSGGAPIVACDVANAGEGDVVMCVSSREATQALSPSFVPVDATVVGVVDRVHEEVER